MAAALANFRDMKAGKKMAILGDMNEPGSRQRGGTSAHGGLP